MRKYIFSILICIVYIVIFITAIPQLQKTTDTGTQSELLSTSQTDSPPSTENTSSREDTANKEESFSSSVSTESTEDEADVLSEAVEQITVSTEASFEATEEPSLTDSNISETEEVSSTEDTSHIPATVGGKKNVNLRAEPSTKSEILTHMLPSDELTILSFYDDTWAMVDYDGTVGYCIIAPLIY